MDPNNKDKTPGWEFVLFADTVKAGLASMEDAYQAHRAGQTDLGGNVGDQSADDVRTRADQLTAWVERTGLLLTEEIVTAAFGAPGEPGNESVIRLFAQSYVSIYAGILAWARNTRCVQAEPEWRPVYTALAAMADDPLREFHEFADDFAHRAHTIADDLGAGRPASVQMTLTLRITISDDATKAFDVALKNLAPPPRRGLFSRR